MQSFSPDKSNLWTARLHKTLSAVWPEFSIWVSELCSPHPPTTTNHPPPRGSAKRGQPFCRCYAAPIKFSAAGPDPHYPYNDNVRLANADDRRRKRPRCLQPLQASADDLIRRLSAWLTWFWPGAVLCIHPRNAPNDRPSFAGRESGEVELRCDSMCVQAWKHTRPPPCSALNI